MRECRDLKVGNKCSVSLRNDSKQTDCGCFYTTATTVWYEVCCWSWYRQLKPVKGRLMSFWVSIIDIIISWDGAGVCGWPSSPVLLLSTFPSPFTGLWHSTPYFFCFMLIVWLCNNNLRQTNAFKSPILLLASLDPCWNLGDATLLRLDSSTSISWLPLPNLHKKRYRKRGKRRGLHVRLKAYLKAKATDYPYAGRLRFLPSSGDRFDAKLLSHRWICPADYKPTHTQLHAFLFDPGLRPPDVASITTT